MKKIVSKFGILLASSLAVVAIAANANAQDANLMRTHIPFAFLAGEQMMPAGDYMVRINSTHQVADLSPLQTTDVRRVALKPASSRRPARTGEEGVLTFVKYGDKYVLRGIWPHGGAMGEEVRTSKAEIELAKTVGAGTPAASETSLFVR